VTAEQAFENHHKAVYRFVTRLAGRADLAEDITQDCFVALLRQPQGWDASRGDMKTYLFSIARNLAFKRFRDDHGGAHVDEELAGAIPDRRVDQELSLAVAQLVGQLPALQRRWQWRRYGWRRVPSRWRCVEPYPALESGAGVFGRSA